MFDSTLSSHADRLALYAVGASAFAKNNEESGQESFSTEVEKDSRYYLWKLTWLQAAISGVLMVLTSLPVAFTVPLAMAISAMIVSLELMRERKSSSEAFGGSEAVNQDQWFLLKPVGRHHI